jgi:hypothetical protein
MKGNGTNKRTKEIEGGKIGLKMMVEFVSMLY